MASATSIPRFTPEQYLTLERKADFTPSNPPGAKMAGNE